MNWLPKLPQPLMLVPECPFRINPDPHRRAGQLHVAVLHDELWLVDEEAERNHADEIPNLCGATFYEGMLVDGHTPFLLPVLDPRWEAGDWCDSLDELVRLARTQWVTVMADVDAGRFRQVPNPMTSSCDITWPKDNLADTVEKAFAGRYITKDFAARNRAFHDLLVESCEWD